MWVAMYVYKQIETFLESNNNNIEKKDMIWKNAYQGIQNVYITVTRRALAVYMACSLFFQFTV